MADLKVGCSGFLYDHWRGVFYPEKLPKSKWFRYYCEKFSTVEMNVTFYRLPSEVAFKKWYLESPQEFSFSIKGSRFITHIKRLKDPEEPLKNFFTRAEHLREKLSIVLWQFPPNMKASIERLANFLNALKKYPFRAAFEFRHDSWHTEEIHNLIKESGFALCMADWPSFNDRLPITAGYTYIRRHGYGGSYDTCYTDEDLQKDAEFIKEILDDGIDVYIYFNNDAFGYAPQNALRLIELIR